MRELLSFLYVVCFSLILVLLMHDLLSFLYVFCVFIDPSLCLQIPIDLHPVTKKSSLETVLTVFLHIPLC